MFAVPLPQPIRQGQCIVLYPREVTSFNATYSFDIQVTPIISIELITLKLWSVIVSF